MRQIMLATDFSERSDRALRRAVLLARATGARIHLVHVVDDDRPRRIVEHETADARILLAELARSLADEDEIACDTQVLLADPFAGIAEAVAASAPDLLVIGPHRRQILRDVFIGTTAERAIRAVHCPVLMANGVPTGRYRHVLLATDLSDTSLPAMQHFAKLGLAGRAELSVLNVFAAPALRLGMASTVGEVEQADYIGTLAAEARQSLATFVVEAGLRRARQHVRHERTTIANEILKGATELQADLIVVATQGKGAIARSVIGSVAEQVLRLSSVDVLAVPPASGVPGATASAVADAT